MLTTEELEDIINGYGSDITCVCFMGGDAEPEYVNMLAEYLHGSYPRLMVAWYSGRARIPGVVRKNDFDYIKTGPYIKHLGGLKSPDTNQRLYKRVANDSFADITSRFWSK